MPNQTERMQARRERAETALRAYQKMRGDVPETEVDAQDLITDLLHLLSYKKRNRSVWIESIMRMVMMNYEAEQAGEP